MGFGRVPPTDETSGHGFGYPLYSSLVPRCRVPLRSPTRKSG